MPVQKAMQNLIQDSDPSVAPVAARALGCLDLTSLNDGDKAGDVHALCAKAKSPLGSPAAVCVWPRFVAQCKTDLQGTGVKVAAVANFPEGGEIVEEVLEETSGIIEAGGDEVDLVFPYRAFLDGNTQIGEGMIADVKALCGPSISLKVILETGELKDPALIQKASELALRTGADFIKTSTGKVPVNATPESARVMLEALRAHKSGGFKAAGGVKDVQTAALYFSIADEIMGPNWAAPDVFRFGASGLLAALHAVLSGEQEPKINQTQTAPY